MKTLLPIFLIIMFCGFIHIKTQKEYFYSKNSQKLKRNINEFSSTLNTLIMKDCTEFMEDLSTNKTSKWFGELNVKIINKNEWLKSPFNYFKYKVELSDGVSKVEKNLMVLTRQVKDKFNCYGKLL